MSDLKLIHTDHAPAAIGPYSQAVVSGEWIYCSGQIALVPEAGEMIDGDAARQADQVLKNLTRVLEEAGSSLAGVVKTTIFLADMGDFAAVNEVYGKHFGSHRPARATVAVAALPRNAAVEIECVARRASPAN